MKKMNVNYVGKKIEVTEAFARKAGVVGSAEYRELVSVQREYPSFEISVIKSKKHGNGITISYDFMRKYITAHDQEKQVLKVFENLVENNVPYLDVRAWFLEQYPVFSECKTKKEWVLRAIA